MYIPVKGVSQYHHLDSVYKQTGEMPAELEDFFRLEMPALFEETFDWFLDLNRRRSYNEGGANPLSYLEIDSWCKLTNNNICNMELNMILEYDNIYLNCLSKKNKPN